MTFLRIYLVGYFLLFLGALVALWQGGVLSQIPAAWVALASAVVVALGMLLALVSSPWKVKASGERRISRVLGTRVAP